MTFFLSPAVSWDETDATLGVKQLSDAIAGMGGFTQWGPARIPTLITGGQDDFERRFGGPNDDTALTFFVARDFLSYSNKMWFVREVGPTAKNAVKTGKVPVFVANDEDLEVANLTGHDFIARYPGSLGNGLVVDIADRSKFLGGWEYRSYFDFVPEAGEFAVMVADGSGRFTGAGATKQTERLSVSGTANGGVQQEVTVTFSGSATGGTKQQEVITITGVATGTTITVDGQAVTIVAGDTANQVATKVATALAGVTARYDSAVATDNTVRVTFKVPGARTQIPAFNSVGVSGTSQVIVNGNANFTATLVGQPVDLAYGDTATVVAQKFLAVATANVAMFKTVTSMGGAVVKLVYLPYGVQDSTASVVVNGVTVAQTVNVPGVNTFNVTAYGASVTLTTGDSASTVAGKIHDAISGKVELTELFESITVDRNTITFVANATGKRDAQIGPSSANGVYYSHDVAQFGSLGTMLEKFELVSNNKAARNPDGSTAYFVDVLRKQSRYVTVGDTTLLLSAKTTTLAGGVDDYNEDLVGAYDLLQNAEQYQVQYFIAATQNPVEQKRVVDLADSRKDCMAFVSPKLSDVLNCRGDELRRVLNWYQMELNRSTSYGHASSGWALVYDKWNDVNRWIPTCGGDAGLYAKIAAEKDPWVSPAGHEKGRYKNYIRLAWSPSKPERDELYKVGINPVASFPGEGILLYGDKTMLSRPSQFAHTNVRWAFTTAEISCAAFSKYYLFEFNNEFTRAQFLNALRPFLRNMMNRGAFEDVRVIVDERNNDPETRANNQMRGMILAKPMNSINWIHLSWVAVRNGTSFEEIEGQLLGGN